jgi:hypothetical protein
MKMIAYSADALLIRASIALNLSRAAPSVFTLDGSARHANQSVLGDRRKFALCFHSFTDSFLSLPMAEQLRSTFDCLCRFGIVFALTHMRANAAFRHGKGKFGGSTRASRGTQRAKLCPTE